MKRAVVALMLIAVVTLIFIHNPFAGYIDHDDEVVYDYVPSMGSNHPCGMAYSFELTIEGSESIDLMNDSLKNTADIVHLNNISSLRKLTTEEQTQLKFLREKSEELSKKSAEQEIKLNNIKALCRRVSETKSTYRPTMAWESKSPLLPQLATVSSLVFCLGFVLILSLILYFSVPGTNRA